MNKIKYFFLKPGYIDFHTLFIQLSVFVDAGIDIVTAINDIASKQKNKLIQEALLNIEKSLLGGLELHQAFFKEKIFEKFVSPSIQAGERSAQLALVFKNLAVIYKQKGELESSINRALLTPKIGFVITILSAVFFAKFLIPKYVQTFENNNMEIPMLLTLFGNSINFLTDNLFLIFVIGYFAFKAISKFLERNPLVVDKFLYKIPIYKELYYIEMQWLYEKNMGQMLYSGLDIKESLFQTSKIVPSVILRNALTDTVHLLESGLPITEGMIQANKNNVLEPLTISLISAGEKTGKLDLMYDSAAKIHESKIKTILSTIELKLTVISLIPLAILIIAMYAISLIPAVSYLKQLGV